MFSVKIFGFEFYYIFYTFILYSVFGWIYETCLVSVKQKEFVNRGFLNGPIIPIYGAGAVLICIILDPVSKNLLLVFLGGMLLATILEFLTSYVMEKLFHAKWWDYSQYKFNIQGRICPIVSVFWGILSVLMTVFLKPISNALIHKIPKKPGEILAFVIFALVVIDLVLTIISTLKLNQKLANMHKLRDELIGYMEKSRFYHSKEELRRKLENATIAEYIDNLKVHVHSGELDERLRIFKEKYSLHSEHVHIIQRRLLKAFPNMKSTNNEYMLTELRERLRMRKKNNK
ncbi:putative ABC transporter permease [Anaerosporobacter faecicola]|uniref:putative ABC transporter permease n=1 Tax=Anaerosporobacter faecicola TaxID=2718714 RepID=UPI00143C057E|nr:putative ABC transporter permease [Anaerosporobacter faecicola]